MTDYRKSAWIVSPAFDSCLITGPAIFITLLAFLFANHLQEMPSWLWLFLVVGVDAGHVYATLFRTYLFNTRSSRQQGLLLLIPLLIWLCGCMLYSLNAGIFWRVLAYSAVFHFVRQQYGFMMIYARHDPKTGRAIDKGVIYAATLFPLIYWHCRGRRFNWFIDGDFFLLQADWLWQLAAMIYAALLLFYAAKEITLWRKHRWFNLPRNLLLSGTALSWFVGIVAFDNDLVFSATNIIAHGIPYYALVWAFGYRQRQRDTTNNPYAFSWLASLFRKRYSPIYVLLLFTLAYWEEGLWDGLVWREHGGIFTLFAELPDMSSSTAMIWLVPLLSLPQATHYALDALIWRFNGEKTDWRQVLLR